MDLSGSSSGKSSETRRKEETEGLSLFALFAGHGRIYWISSRPQAKSTKDNMLAFLRPNL